MLDYHSHIAALKAIEAEMEKHVASIGGGQSPESAVHKAMQDNPSYAALGAVFEHLVEHSESSDRELKLLENASELWKLFKEFIADTASIRKDLESLVLDPEQSGASDKFTALADKLNNEMKQRFQRLQASQGNRILTECSY